MGKIGGSGELPLSYERVRGSSGLPANGLDSEFCLPNLLFFAPLFPRSQDGRWNNKVLRLPVLYDGNVKVI